MKNNFKDADTPCGAEASPISALSGIAIILLLSLAYQIMFWKIGYFQADEGLMVAVCERMLRGEALYRDIFLPFTPLAWYVEVGAFRLFGLSLATARMLPILLFSAASGIIYLWSREVMSSTLALLCSVTFIFYRIWVWPYWQFYTYSVLAYFLAIATGYAFIFSLKCKRPRFSVILCGFLAGLCFWARPNVGVQILAAVFLTLVTKLALPDAGEQSREVSRGMSFVRTCLLFSLGLLQHPRRFLFISPPLAHLTI